MGGWVQGDYSLSTKLQIGGINLSIPREKV